MILNGTSVTMVDINRHINLAANVCNYTPANLGKLIKKGILSEIDSIHRETINLAIWKKEHKEI